MNANRMQVVLVALAGAAVAGVLLPLVGRLRGRPGGGLRRVRVPPRDALGYQQGGFAGPFASPGLGVDDCNEEISGIVLITGEGVE